MKSRKSESRQLVNTIDSDKKTVRSLESFSATHIRNFCDYFPVLAAVSDDFQLTQFRTFQKRCDCINHSASA